MNVGYSLAVSLLHWSYILVKLEILIGYIGDVPLMDMRDFIPVLYIYSPSLSVSLP